MEHSASGVLFRFTACWRFAEAGNDLIVEHILDTPGWHAELQALLSRHDIVFVGLRPPLAPLTQREKIRGNRPAGSAARDAAHAHDGLRYDLEFDGSTPVADMAQTLLTHLQTPRPRSCFFAG
ncbi:phosphotransferase-like protein [Phaeobacter piscinae]|uniref:phosphotransferase-like protein n=1 Tax=Phaeobacter piscinae TaxID=1580596 RepID=UPI0039F6C06B